MSSCSSAISSKVCRDRVTGLHQLSPGSRPTGGTPGPRDETEKAHIFLLPPELTVQFLHLPQPLPEGKFCGHPLGFEFIVGLKDRIGRPRGGCKLGAI